MRFRILFTLDYEIHGNGHGSPRRLMVDPTDRMLEQFDRHGARLTIMADVAEILRFRRHRDETGSDDFGYDSICEQLQQAVRTDHDVQLHLHPSYYRSRFVDGHLEQAYDDYDLARLPAERIGAMVREGKEWLEGLLRPARTSYRCTAFRAANWSMNPSSSIARALVGNGITIESSVFKYGKRDGLVHFDYSSADSDLIPWPADLDDICRRDEKSPLVEFPIYCEQQPLWKFLTLNRIHRAVQGRLNPLPQDEFAGSSALPERSGGLLARAARLRDLIFERHPWKLDFNQCSGAQLIDAIRRIESRYGTQVRDLPIVLIGHSKIYTRHNERSLEPFLRFVVENGDRFAFGIFPDFDPGQFAARAA